MLHRCSVSILHAPKNIYSAEDKCTVWGTPAVGVTAPTMNVAGPGLASETNQNKQQTKQIEPQEVGWVGRSCSLESKVCIQY
ncbi:hypothetical protein EMCRGX_G026402 [Ephydatia muelleri]